jgi:hypothetical protein
MKNFENEALYLDFGRYHTPYGHGRVRDKFIDHELKLKTEMEWTVKGNPLNINHLLNEIQRRAAIHGKKRYIPEYPM